MLISIKNKLEAQLEEAQKGCKSRILDVDTVLEIANCCESVIAKLPGWTYEFLTYYFYENVCKSYGHRAESTKLVFSFNKKGEINKVDIYRGVVNSNGVDTSRLTLDIRGAMHKEFGLDDHGKVAAEVLNFAKLEAYFLKSLGFTPNWHKEINLRGN